MTVPAYRAVAWFFQNAPIIFYYLDDDPVFNVLDLSLDGYFAKSDAIV